jgi:alpha-ribazole phosphatase
MKITVVRHTSVDAPKGTCYGITDVPVALSFSEELEQVRKNLENKEFDAVFSSPLQRCTKLARELAKNLPVFPDSLITELDFGDWEMSNWDAIFESPAGKAWFADYANTACPNGESFAGQIERTASFLSDLQQKPFKHVLVVTHAGVIRALMCLRQNKTPQEAFLTPVDNGQIITFNFNPEWKTNQ